MNVTLHKLPKSQAKLSIELQPSEIEHDLAAAAERISAARKFPGFRPGKVPYEHVLQQVGEAAIWEEALPNIVTRSYAQAVRQHQLKAIGQPQVSIEKMAPGNPFSFSATVSFLPSIELLSYGTLALKRTYTIVTDDDVAQAIEDIRRVLATEQPVDRAAAAGDRLEVNLRVTLNGIPIEGGQSNHHPVTIGSQSFIPGFEEQLIGLKTGQVKEFTLSFPPDYHAKHLAGKPAQFTVTVQKVSTVSLPAVDEGFARRVAGVSTVDELRARIRRDVEAERRQQDEQNLEVTLLDELVKRSRFGELPELLIEHELDRMVAETKQDVERRGMKYEDYLSSMKKDESAWRQNLRPAAERRVKTALVIRRISELENISVTEDEIKQEIQRARESLKDPSQQERIESDDFRDYITSVLANRKAIDAAKAKNVLS